jgi:Aldo/keto reductase family
VALAQPVGDTLAEHTMRLGTDEKPDMAVPVDLLVVGAADLRRMLWCAVHSIARVRTSRARPLATMSQGWGFKALPLYLSSRWAVSRLCSLPRSPKWQDRATSMQVALAWLLQRSPNILLIPGTSSLEHLRENLAAVSLVLSNEALERLDGAV